MRFLLPLTLCLGCSGEPVGIPQKPPDRRPVLSVAARQLTEDYATNALAADGKYKGKYIEVVASVVSVQKAGDGYSIHLADIRGARVLYNIDGRIARSSEKDFAAVKPSEMSAKIKVVGKVLGAEERRGAHLNTVIFMEDCRLP